MNFHASITQVRFSDPPHGVSVGEPDHHDPPLHHFDNFACSPKTFHNQAKRVAFQKAGWISTLNNGPVTKTHMIEPSFRIDMVEWVKCK